MFPLFFYRFTTYYGSPLLFNKRIRTKFYSFYYCFWQRVSSILCDHRTRKLHVSILIFKERNSWNISISISAQYFKIFTWNHLIAHNIFQLFIYSLEKNTVALRYWNTETYTSYGYGQRIHCTTFTKARQIGWYKFMENKWMYIVQSY